MIFLQMLNLYQQNVNLTLINPKILTKTYFFLNVQFIYRQYFCGEIFQTNSINDHGI